MRRHDDPIQVRLGRDDDPIQFIWREQLWRVLSIESHWIESGSWWTGPAVRAARGQDEGSHGGARHLQVVGSVRFDDVALGGQGPGGRPERSGDTAADGEGDLLCESEVWRVEAANGMAGSRGIYELAHAVHTGAWQLRGVMD